MEYYTIPKAAFDQAVQIANKAGFRGQIARIDWIAPATAAQSPTGAFAVEYHKPTIDDVI